MRSPLHNDNFETFVQQSVKDHRIYPADQIWRNIQKEIHGDCKWPALTYISIFIITALAISTLMVKPEERMKRNAIVYPANPQVVSFENSNQKQNMAEQAAAPLQSAYADKITQRTLQSVSESIIAHKIEQESSTDISITKESLFSVQNKVSHEIVTAAEPVVKTSAKQETYLPTQAVIKTEDKNEDINTLSAASKPASRYFSTMGLVNPADLKKSSDNDVSAYNDDIWRSYALLSTKDLIIKKLSKLSFQFYIAPSVSYRRLNDAHGKTAQSYTALPVTTNYRIDINHVVEHRPAVGAEVGFALGYQLTPALMVKGGFQFNMRQYGIKAYTVPKPASPAAILNGTTTDNSQPDEHTDNSYLAVNNSVAESVPVVLNNRYYEISAPVGIDWHILSSGNGKLTLNVAAALQPTYTFDKEPFVLTTDYKSYTDGTSIMRNWNLNSNVEAYVSYKLGPFRWQLGPQFRYQHFSTYSNSYPIREHLLDYGIKFGFTKSLD